MGPPPMGLQPAGAAEPACGGDGDRYPATPPGILVVAAAATLATAVAANEKYPVVSAWSSTMVDESRMMSQDSG